MTTSCEQCPLYNGEGLTRVGINMEDWDYLVALAGNPNTGKSTLFNALTGLRQHTGNWPGKTVARAEGGFLYDGLRYKVVDLPGTYSLLSTSVDEEVARDFILFGRPTVTVVVVDASRLERNLNLVLQILEITDRVVVALNLMDEAERRGLKVDERTLARDLGVPVVPMVAREGEGVNELLQTIAQVADGRIHTRPHRVKQRDSRLERAISRLEDMLEDRFPALPNARWVALRLLDNDESIVSALRSGTLGEISGFPVPQAPSRVQRVPAD